MHPTSESAAIANPKLCLVSHRRVNGTKKNNCPRPRTSYAEVVPNPAVFSFRNPVEENSMVKFEMQSNLQRNIEIFSYVKSYRVTLQEENSIRGHFPESRHLFIMMHETSIPRRNFYR